MKKSISLTIILVILISIANSGFCQYSKLRLGTKMNNANGYTNEIVIYFIQGATNGKDEYDATAMWNTDLYTPNSYFIIHDNRLWLDGVPPLINNRLDIMGLQVNTSGSFTITASQITDFPRNTKIFLIDSVLHKKQDLITNPTYGPFNFNTTDNEFRFYLYFQLPSTEPYGIIYGKTFFDKNNNCKYDDKEIDIRNVKVMLYKNNEVFDIYYTNSSGYYFFDVPVSDNYVIKTDSSKYTGYNLNCSSSSIPIKTFPANYDFGYICGETSKQELYTYMEGWGFRPGDKGGIRLNIDNNSCSIFNAKAKIWCSTKNSTFTRFSPYGTITQDTIVWDLKDLDNSKTYTSWFEVLVSPDAYLTDTICFNAIIIPSNKTTDESSIIINKCFPVKNSWDPNDKVVSPVMYDKTSIYPDSTLNYTINFENIGNAEAINISIVDTLDKNLDISTLKVISYSHSALVSTTFINTGTILKFTFSKINLPYKSADEILSHGYVTYSIKPKSGLSIRTCIKNTAYIYFDYNPGIKTNTLQNNISINNGISHVKQNISKIEVFPNPVNHSSIVRYQLAVKSNVTIKVYDLLGREVEALVTNERQQAGEHTIRYDVNNLRSGVYIINIRSNNFTAIEKLVIQR